MKYTDFATSGAAAKASPRKATGRNGISITEILAVLALFGLCLAIALPKLSSVANARAVSGAADGFVRTHELARSTAQRFGRDAMLHISASTGQFWVDADTSGNGTRAVIGTPRNTGETQVRMSSADTLLCFDARGLRSTRGLCQGGAAIVVFSRLAQVDTVSITTLGKAVW